MSVSRRFFENPDCAGLTLPDEVVDFVPSRDFTSLKEDVSVDERYKSLVRGFQKQAEALRFAKVAKAADYNRAISAHMNTMLELFDELRLSYSKRAELEAYRASMESSLLNTALTVEKKLVTKDVSKMGPGDLCKYHDSLSKTIRERYLGLGKSWSAWAKQPGSASLMEAMDDCAEASRRYTLSLEDFETFKENYDSLN